MNFDSLVRFGFANFGVARDETQIRRDFRKGAHILLKLNKKGQEVSDNHKWVVLKGVTSQSYIINDPTPAGDSQISPRDVEFA